MKAHSLQTRRHFLSSTLLAGASLTTSSRLLAQEGTSRKFTINLVCGALGVQATQSEAIDLAAKYGFESVEARAEELAKLNDDELALLRQRMDDAKLTWGTAGLSVEFRQNEDAFRSGMETLPTLAAALKRAGVKRVGTWLMPCHSELTYLQNVRQHAQRLREIATVLKDQDIRLGLEYVGTPSLLVSRKYPFVHSLAETRELIAEIGTGNVGVVLDSWHWWCAGDSAEDIKTLKDEDVILVDLNDAPKGVEKRDQQDGRRQLPGATGVIDLAAFVKALVAIGYTGPARAEPFNQTLNDLDNELACAATIAALRKTVALAG